MVDNHFELYKDWEKYLFSVKNRDDFEKELTLVKKELYNIKKHNKKDLPLLFFKYISTIKFNATLFCDDFTQTDYYEFINIKMDLIKIHTYLRTNFFIYPHKVEDKIEIYFNDINKIEKFLNRNLQIDHEADQEVRFWCIKKRYFNEIIYEDEYSSSSEYSSSEYE